MASTDTASTTIVEDIPRRPTVMATLGAFSRENPLGAFGGAIVVIMIVMAVFAPWLTTFDPTSNDFGAMLSPPDGEHFLGTDQFGRDLLSRIIFGARTALLVGFVSAFTGCFLGLVLGVTSAYFGGRFDLLFQRVMDVFMAFPLIILALAVVAIFGTGVQNVIIAITIPVIPRAARIVRASALAIREMPYVDAARANGFSHSRIIFRHMMPNVMAPFLIILTA
jgi:peptide/nickel transport system permease protein